MAPLACILFVSLLLILASTTLIAIYFRWIAIYLNFNYLNVYMISLIAFFLFLFLANEYFVWPYLWLNVLVHDSVITGIHTAAYTNKTCTKFDIMTKVFIVYCVLSEWRKERERDVRVITIAFRCTFSYYICKQWSKCRWYSSCFVFVACRQATCLHSNSTLYKLNAYFHGSLLFIDCVIQNHRFFLFFSLSFSFLLSHHIVRAYGARWCHNYRKQSKISIQESRVSIKCVHLWRSR